MVNPQADIFDFVIVGGGTAAGIIAWRLGEAGYSVCVLEAGPPDRNPYIHIPAGFSKTLGDPKITWQFKSDPGPGIADRSIVYAQGKTLGGSSSINGMIYNRGQAADFDQWAQAGNTGWSYDDVLPHFRRTEKRVGASVDPSYRGTDGRFAVTTTEWPTELEQAFHDTALNVGYPPNADYNGASQEGVGRYQSSISNGWRVSTATAFLRPAQRKFKVDVRCNALATSIQIDGKCATGAHYREGDQDHLVLAKREVIIAAGTLNSPKLLQLSGIGPAPLLAQHGIASILDLPAVGENLKDHFSPRIVARAKPGLKSINQYTTGLPLVGQAIRWLMRRPNLLAISPGRVHVFGKSTPELENPDYVLLFAPASYKAGMVGVLDNFPGFTVGTWQMRPHSSGYVRIASNDPRDDPHFNPRHLSDPADGPVLLTAMRAARTLLAAEPLASLIDQEVLPGDEFQSDDELMDFARNFGATSFHLVGSCRMGLQNDGSNVVDPRLRVHGVEGLRVVDASIMPTIPSANTAAATMMIGEKGAAMIIEDAR
jgi:choline dehydrogenase